MPVVEATPVADADVTPFFGYKTGFPHLIDTPFTIVEGRTSQPSVLPKLTSIGKESSRGTRVARAEVSQEV